ncbi:MAG: 16S rRNA (cytosine(967)-C(5))-methyltransferase RsmB [Gemmatimonadetes bacterium]|nr:16S rRNA (cytosine(967)-C(5))-methyltransferase RsmB [Gemmatimonadota bacterium]
MTHRSHTSATTSTPVTDARRAAADVCADLRTGVLLGASMERRCVALDPRDRRWLQELVFGMLRRRGWIDHALISRVRGGLARLDGDLADLIRLGAYQLLEMGSVPAYAAIAQTVELAKQRHGLGASKLVNAVLRRLDRERSSLGSDLPSDPIDALATEFSHPRWLVARWVARWGPVQTRDLLEANNQEAPIILRPWGMVREQLEAKLEAAGLRLEDAPLCDDSIRINGSVNLADLAPFVQGACLVQDPAATLVTRYAAIPAGSTVADLCSAPGGKSVELSRQAALVISADLSPTRLTRLRDTVLRLDLPNVAPVAFDARHPAIGAVDAVLVDAPCTGTGTFRRHPDARWRLRMSDLAVTALMQRDILRAAARLVKPGGLLIYSTCTLEPEENETQVEAFLAANPDWRLEPPPAGAVPDSTLDQGFLRVLPHLHGADGAFAARLRRPS